MIFARKNMIKGHVNNIAIAAIPKSASRYFVSNFQEMFSNTHELLNAKSSAGFGHNFLSKEKILSANSKSKNTAIQGHFPLTASNNKLLSELCLDKKAICIIRSLPDLIVSHYDHVVKRVHGPQDFRIVDYPLENSIWQTLDKKKKLDYLIKFCCPWYIRFVNSWVLSKKIGWNTQFAFFEEHTSDIQSTLLELSEKLDISRDANLNINTKHKVNYNVGKTGRGKDTLTKGQIKEIKMMVELLISDSDMGYYLLNGK